MTSSAWDAWDASDGGRRVPEQVLDSAPDAVHSALVPPGTLHRRVTAALANWQLDDAEELLADVEREPSPYVVADPVADAPADAPVSLGKAWADTLRAELLVRRLRVAGFTLVGDPVTAGAAAGDPLDLHAGVADLIEGTGEDGDPRSESASRAALAIALVRSAKAAFDASDDDLQRAAGLARHARIELLSRRIDAAMDEAVEAASLLDPVLPPSALLVDTLGTLAGVLADLELMPLALDYQRRAHEAALTAAADPAAAGWSGDGDAADVVVATTATCLGELCAELGEGLLDDGVPESAVPHFAEARLLAEKALELLPPDSPGLVPAQVVHGWALVGLGEHAAAVGPLRAAVRVTSATADRAQLASAQLALGRALRRQGDVSEADEHLVSALSLATEHGLPRLRRAALRELCTLHAELDDAGRALPYLQAYLSDELDRVDERRTRWVELFGRRKSLLETERAAGQLRRQAYEDPLTHLPNRRYAEARLDGLLATGGAPALAVVDVDRFKSINDAFGHPAGDAALRTVGELLVAGVRDTDEVCRWAGDEFVILLPDTTAEQGERALERIRRSVATYDWSSLGIEAPVTISVGIASAARGDDRRTLFAAADGVLYDAKRSGRDRVVRLSGVTQTRAAGASPLDVLFGPPPSADGATPSGPDDDGTADGATADTHTADSGTAGTGTADTRTPDAGGPGSPVASPAPDATPVPRPAAEAADGFAPLLVPPRPAHPPLGTGGPAEPLLGPLPASGPVVVPAAPAAVQPAAVEPAPVPPTPVEPATPAAARRTAAVEPEVVWATGRTTEQVLALVREARREHPDRPALVLRAGAETLVALASEHDAYTTMDAAAMAAAVGPVPEPVGRVHVLCAGGADGPVAAEVAFVARVSGTAAVRLDDVAGSRLRDLLADGSAFAGADCLVVVAGLDASLAATVGEAADVPVVAVPTSAGTPNAFAGLGALVTMLNSAAPGVAVTAIDNGWSAGVFAARVARRAAV
ncbi:diguanylate cyclase domain-containing protein [Blastococcus tunisiensis]|uniref:Diguanylate cyclase (GGDEF) domain-containing protein n=1 Tax=Blastococcus tunisiensis TaxID=1798228 RepID=A0A1I2KI93_9ACTN|nr:diguanylate cyclase [Blastococcus sp. DSM 46838]SFF64987.1 diguanylate cyclase (GGDEF) domain-containing protein [Blastococcus sp. DSM 46838]